MLSAFFHKFFTYQYWFAPVLPNISISDQLLYYFGIVLVLAGIILFFAMRGQKDLLRQKLLKRWTYWAFFSGLGFVAWYALRYELIDYFSTHIVWLLVFLASLLWLIFVFKYQFAEHARLRQEFDREQIKKKYL
jgi:Ca2+/Na+ antiporter